MKYTQEEKLVFSIKLGKMFIEFIDDFIDKSEALGDEPTLELFKQDIKTFVDKASKLV